VNSPPVAGRSLWGFDFDAWNRIQFGLLTVLMIEGPT
jgi:hypothetical protein